MRRVITILYISVIASFAAAQNVTLTFRDTPLPEALRQIDNAQSDYAINFVYENLDPFRITKQITNLPAPEAVKSLCANLPIKIKTKRNAIFVNASKAAVIDTTLHINLVGKIEDDFLKIPLLAKVTLHDMDSTCILDTVPITRALNSDGKLVIAAYSAPVKAFKRDYLVHAELDNYGDVWQKVQVRDLSGRDIEVPTLRMRRTMSRRLSEVTVTATRIKMFWRGDTLVYDATAFKLPDGSMLDDLIRQMDGVTINNAGEIFVNGRKVDELLLGSRSIFGGNKRILMENLPYYTVKNIKVYDKQTDKSEVLGYDVEPRKYVMDVSLKDEYRTGYIANVEAAAGTEERWLGRGFLLGFTDQWRFSLMANANNVNESRHIGQQGHWTPASAPKSLTTTRSVAADIDYQSKDKKTSNNLNADFASTDNDRQMRQRHETFLDGSCPTSLTESTDHAGNWQLRLHDVLKLKTIGFGQLETRFEYGRRDGSANSLFEETADSLTVRQRTEAMSEGRRWVLEAMFSGAFNINKAKKKNLDYFAYYRQSDDQSWRSTRFDTRQFSRPSSDVRHNANDVRNANRGGGLFLTHRFRLNEKQQMNMSLQNQTWFYDEKLHDWLYHPDTLLLASQLDMLAAITDPRNSYDSRQSEMHDRITLSFDQDASYKLSKDNPFPIVYRKWDASVNLEVCNKRLDYQRAALDTTARKTWLLVNPTLAYRYVSPEVKHDISVRAEYNRYCADMLNLMPFHDDSQPLVRREGNPALKNETASSTLTLDYYKNRTHLPVHINLSGTYHHRAIAQSVAYDPATGIYTYRPENISGAYSATARFDITRSIGKQKRWTWQTNADANFHHSLDHTTLAGENASHKNAVNTLVLHDGVYIQYSKGVLNVRVTGDIRWRHSEGKMRDFQTLNAFDYQYGMTARYTLPVLKTTLSADANMYSRRGYGSASLNTDDFVINASISQPLLKGKLIARLEAFDLLHNLSSTLYEVNAQGRTENFYRSLPHYVMAHLVYHWNKNPKKK